MQWIELWWVFNYISAIWIRWLLPMLLLRMKLLLSHFYCHFTQLICILSIFDKHTLLESHQFAKSKRRKRLPSICHDVSDFNYFQLIKINLWNARIHNGFSIHQLCIAFAYKLKSKTNREILVKFKLAQTTAPIIIILCNW